MAEPPRLSEIKIPWEQSIVYFVTLCVDGRRPVLADGATFEAIKATTADLRRWRITSGVVMPDHVHFSITPVEDRALTPGDFASGFKRLLRKRLVSQKWEWQRGCFDRLLRSSENAQEKWMYMEQNPVRVGLVKDIRDWPYYLGSMVEGAKLTASPTAAATRGGVQP